MQSHFFFLNHIPQTDHVILDEASSHHLYRVLRMMAGEKIVLTNGKGILAEAIITTPHKSQSEIQILEQKEIPFILPSVTIAISPIKNVSRFEWFIEKCSELGIQKIIPIICDRTEKINFKQERLLNILKSGLLQSKQAWMPELLPTERFKNIMSHLCEKKRFIAHCNPDENKILIPCNLKKEESRIILIGPEGDFSDEEINIAKSNDFMGVSLGPSVLRTETAGIAAAVLLRQSH